MKYSVWINTRSHKYLATRLFSSSKVSMPISGNTFNNVGQFGFCCIKEWQRGMLIVTVVLIFAGQSPSGSVHYKSM